MQLGTVLVLIGAILFGLALLFDFSGRWPGRFGGTTLLALAGLLTAIGVLLGAPPVN